MHTCINAYMHTCMNNRQGAPARRTRTRRRRSGALSSPHVIFVSRVQILMIIMIIMIMSITIICCYYIHTTICIYIYIYITYIYIYIYIYTSTPVFSTPAAARLQARSLTSAEDVLAKVASARAAGRRVVLVFRGNHLSNTTCLIAQVCF